MHTNQVLSQHSDPSLGSANKKRNKLLHVALIVAVYGYTTIAQSGQTFHSKEELKGDLHVEEASAERPILSKAHENDYHIPSNERRKYILAHLSRQSNRSRATVTHNANLDPFFEVYLCSTVH